MNTNWGNTDELDYKLKLLVHKKNVFRSTNVFNIISIEHDPIIT